MAFYCIVLATLSMLKLISVKNKYADQENYPFNLDISDKKITTYCMLSAIFFTVFALVFMFQ